MFSERLMWAFAGLSIFCGLPLFVVSDFWWGQFWSGLTVLFLACFAFAMAYNAICKGGLKLQFSLIQRNVQPKLFWTAVTLIGCAGLMVIVSGVKVLFF